MTILDPTVADACFMVDDDLLDFQLDGGACDDSSSSLDSFITAAGGTPPFLADGDTGSFPEFVEEELEWLSNKDAFPSVDTCFGILADNPQLITNHQSPVSVLENSSTSSNASGITVASCSGGPKVNHPVRARTKGRRPRKMAFSDLQGRHYPWLSHVNVKNKGGLQPAVPKVASSGGGIGRRCLHCQTDKTPQWRAGPMGPKTLCNACGVRYKSGRLLPEYRPANSPTFSSALHSNSHRKVVEMRRQKVGPGGGTMMANEGCGYRVE